LTSSRKRDGIPHPHEGGSCFVEASLPWSHSGLVLQPLHRLWVRSRKPCGTVSVLRDTRQRGSCWRQEKERCTLVQHGHVFASGPSPENPPKRDSVVKVRYMHDSTGEHTCQQNDWKSGSGAFIPSREREWVFPRRIDKPSRLPALQPIRMKRSYR
jgi:hypothetical protein